MIDRNHFIQNCRHRQIIGLWQALTDMGVYFVNVPPQDRAVLSGVIICLFSITVVCMRRVSPVASYWIT